MRVKFHAGIFKALCVHGISFDLAVVRGRQQLAAPAVQLVQNSERQCRPLFRVRPRAHLVDEHQAVRFRFAQNINDVAHVRAKSRERLLDALFVSNIRKNLLKERQTAALQRRQEQPALRHGRKQADHLECNRLATGIRAGDDERPVLIRNRDRNRNHFLCIDQRVPARANIDCIILVKSNGHGPHPNGQCRLGENQIQIGQNVQICLHFIGISPSQGGKLQQNPLDLLLLLFFQHPQAVVRLNNAHGLNEQRRAAGRLPVNQPRDIAAVFLLHRDNIPPISHGDDRILQMRRMLFAADDRIELFAHKCVFVSLPAPNIPQRRRCLIRNLLFTQNRVIDAPDEHIVVK